MKHTVTINIDMKKLSLAIAALAMMLCFGLQAQEIANFGGRGGIKSPEINADNTVTFRFVAPKARTMQITGNFMPTEKRTFQMMGRETTMDVPIIENMIEKNGIWEYTTSVLSPDLYTYNFLMDGVAVKDPANYMLQRDGVNFLNIFIIPGVYSNNFMEAKHRGNLEKVWYDSPTIGTNRRMYIYLPYGYADNPKQKYPVLYLLHGGGGDEDAWSTMGRACQIMDNLIEQGKAVPMIVVMPNGNPTQQAAATEGIPEKQLTQEEGQNPANRNLYVKSLVKDIVPYIEKHYRAIPKFTSRAIAGLSMGGGHTLAASTLYPDEFAYICPLSMGIQANQDYSKEFAAIKKAGFKLYWIGVGSSDFTYASAQNLDKAFTNAGLEHTFFVSGGGHTWPNWRLYLSTFAPLLFK